MLLRKIFIGFDKLVVLTIVLWTIFEDQHFSKNNARELVEEQQILLVDKFDLEENKSTSAIGDYYYTFTLNISVKDKQSAILKIKSAKNFKSQTYEKESLPYQQQDIYFGPKAIHNYETQNSYVREYFQPSGQEGYAPTVRRISISKSENQLTFEDIDE